MSCVSGLIPDPRGFMKCWWGFICCFVGMLFCCYCYWVIMLCFYCDFFVVSIGSCVVGNYVFRLVYVFCWKYFIWSYIIIYIFSIKPPADSYKVMLWFFVVGVETSMIFVVVWRCWRFVHLGSSEGHNFELDSIQVFIFFWLIYYWIF